MPPSRGKPYSNSQMPTVAGCQAVTDAFISETGRIGPELFRKSALKRPIIGLVGANRGTWPNGMGQTISNITFERSFSTVTTDPWQTMTPSDGGSGNSCLPTVTQVTFGETQRTYSVKQMAMQTGYFCIRDILYNWQFSKVLGAVVKNLAARTEWEWARKWTADYHDISGHNLTLKRGTGAGAGIVDNGSAGYDVNNAPTAHLSFGVLEEIYTAQMREGPSVMGVAEDTEAPVAVAIMGDEQYRMLLRDNVSLATNINYAFMGKGNDNPLLPSGWEKKRKLFGNYVIYTDPYPRRFALTGGQYVEIPVFVSSSTTKGNKQDINPAYKAAPYEEVIIYNPDVYKSLAYNTMTNPSPGWKFDPINSMGDWVARNILERDCNPRGDQIFWDALLADSAEPINPEVGYSILVLRCGYPLALNTCYGD